MDLTQIKTELDAFFRVNNRLVVSAVYGEDVQLNQYCRKITRVKGKFPAIHGVVGHVVQGFEATWNELGEAKFKVNEPVAYHQKVNFPIIPSQVEGTWLAEMDEEDKDLANKSISQFIWNELLNEKVIDDVNILSGTGVYDANDLGTFGKSMNGLQKTITDGIANTDNPMFRIALNALTDTNIVDEVTAFERRIPERVKDKIKTIFMSQANLERYIEDYENSFGANTLIKNGDVMKTRIGKREIVGLKALAGTDIIFATPKGNMLQLIDKFDKPTVTDTQIQDYKLKIFMEWFLGYNFYINQLVFVSNYDNNITGLGTDADNELYYPNAEYVNGSGSSSASGSASGV